MIGKAIAYKKVMFKSVATNVDDVIAGLIAPRPKVCMTSQTALSR